MVEQSSIEWTDHTFNPWEGCQKAGPGCDGCYAEARNARFNHGEAVNWGPGAPRRRTSEANWRDPRKWAANAEAFYSEHGRRQRVFCASLADVFDNAVDPQWRADLFRLIAETPQLDWLLLTKRIGNVASMAPDLAEFPHVWLGITVVNQPEADRDIPKLLATPAAVRFLSMEPLLGPVDLNSNLGGTLWIGGQRGCAGSRERSGAMHNGIGTPECPRHLHHHHDDRCKRGIDWVIVGGESGSKARPMHPDWARSLRDQCARAGVPFLFKQWGEWEVALDRERDDPDWRADYTNLYGDCGKSKWINLAGGCGFHGERFHVMRRVGKKNARRLLDGVEHNGFPK